ncbi:uncharacterized protein ACHE_20730A [Aspergillus chevalieri]|uniref:Calcineurin-like phosphoesterase domain-containing protein n=1 Tax=Aspergillus chevalieri TaxID=182096 RepID=A0A7R7VID2_ASPCH|nr:uncharacterized protein ACHE_20730A [Aspergillus chevalieri]BCR85272.1 hypothetical protein ACHE_20730A [Aspergillus chevalieri]
MSLFFLARRLLFVLFPLAIAATVYLYFYPIFHGCAFPLPRKTEEGDGNQGTNPLLATFRQHVGTASADEPAIFRLLVLADPQLEGDSSLPSPDNALSVRIQKHWLAVKSALQYRSDDDNDTSESDADESDTDDEDEDDTNSLEHYLQNAYATILTTWRTLITKDVPRSLRAAQKRLDLLGNDYYLAHIYRTLHWWTRPSHVTVLGDLVGSQWVTDEEFDRRGNRYWDRVFKGGERVSDEITVTGQKGHENHKVDDKSGLEQLGANPAWDHRIINIAGNHDIGYSGDVSESRLERFERVFGRANWDIRFQHPISDHDNSTVIPTLHVINLNTLTLDSPALSEKIQADTYDYINDVISHRTWPVEDRTTFTLLLTHLPMHKEDGICMDGPYFTYHENDDERDIPRFLEGGLREQNHLSEHLSTNGILQGIFGMSGNEEAPTGGFGRNGLILTGHDHTGCDVVHFVNRTNEDAAEQHDSSESESGQQAWKWKAKRYSSHHDARKDTPSIREITLRSMMGEYGGNAGLLSLWFDADPTVNEWRYEITMCAAGVQHIWWAVHVIDLVTVIVFLVYILALAFESSIPWIFYLAKGQKERKDLQKRQNGGPQSNGTTKPQQTKELKS